MHKCQELATAAAHDTNIYPKELQDSKNKNDGADAELMMKKVERVVIVIAAAFVAASLVFVLRLFAAVAAGADVALVDVTAVGASVFAAGAFDAEDEGIGVAVADVPHASMATSKSAMVPMVINFDFLSM